MGTMNKLRENTGIILWILVVSFGGLWVLQDSGVFDTIGSNPLGEIIVVDGDAITYQEYDQAVNAQVSAYQQQTGEPMPPQRLDQEYERVYLLLVDDKLREHEMDRLGITVTDDELTDLILGPDPHPLIKAYFGDGQGGVDRALLQNFIDDPEAEEQWVQLESYLRAERRREKLDKLIAATVRVTDQDVEDEYLRQNRKVAVDYFFLRYADISDDSIDVSDRDLRRYYDEHREDYKRERTFSLKIASVSKVPSPEDTTATLDDLLKLEPTFADAEDDSSFLSRYGSERPYSSAFFTAADLDAPISTAVFENPEVGRIVGPIISGDQVHLVKILETRPAEEQSVMARHILIRASEGNAEEIASARRRAEELKTRIQNGEDFATLARQFSDDKGSGLRGGDLGWFGPGQMVEPFQDAAFAAPVGQVVGPVQTQYGMHLIQVQERADQEVRIADYAQPLRASNSTLASIQENLEDLQYFTEENGDFEAEALRIGLPIQDLQVEQDQQFLPGIGNSRSLSRFLQTASTGDISDVIELNDYFLVAYVAEVQPEGYRPFDEVKDELRPRVVVDKKKTLQVQRMESAYAAGGFDGLGQALNTAPRSTSALTFSTATVAGLGREPVFVGTVMGLQQGEDSGVVEGESAVFAARVTSVNEPPPMTEEQRTEIHDRLLNQRRSLVQNQWLASLRDKADIEDRRNEFLR